MKRRHSGSVVFLTEVLLALTIFALCSSVCAGLLFWSHRLSGDNTALNQAVIAAQSGAEAFKANAGAEALAAAIKGVADADRCTVYYDADWRVAEPSAAAYVMDIALSREGDLRSAEIVVSASGGTGDTGGGAGDNGGDTGGNGGGDSEIFRLSVAAPVKEGRP